MKSPEEMQGLLRDARSNSEFVLQAILIQAPMVRAKYSALIKEGFTEAQALELCKGALLQ